MSHLSFLPIPRIPPPQATKETLVAVLETWAMRSVMGLETAVINLGLVVSGWRRLYILIIAGVVLRSLYVIP